MASREGVRFPPSKTMPVIGRREVDEDAEREATSSSIHHADYLMEAPPRDRLKSSRRSRLNLITNEYGLQDSCSTLQRMMSRERLVNGIRGCSKNFYVYPDSRGYRLWIKFILVWAVYSSFLTPFEFGFFRGLPRKMFIQDVAGQIAFLVDIILQFFVVYRDSETYGMVFKRSSIALRYMQSTFVIDLLACFPWDLIFKASGHQEVVRYILWIRLIRVRKITNFLNDMEKDIRVNFLFTRILKLLFVELYCTHTAACIFYYLATTLPHEEEGYTWIGSLTLGNFSYVNFRDIGIWTRYTTSLYFAIITMATVGYGDIHAVNLREMIFLMIYVSFDMVLGAYLIGNVTAMLVKGSKTEKFREKMTEVMKYMNRNRLGRDLRTLIKGHLVLQYESSFTDASILQDIPFSLRAKISQQMYTPYIESISLFRGCSTEFINQIVIRVHEEFFLPGEVIMEHGNVVDQLYFVCDGKLEAVGITDPGTEETVSVLEHNSLFGEISILCNIPQPYTVKVLQLCRLLRIDKQSFTDIIEIYFSDGRKIFNNLLEADNDKYHVKRVESDITYHIAKQESELALKVNNAVYNGDMHQLKNLIRTGANPKNTDYDGRSPLHLAASRGYDNIALYLMHVGVDMNITDHFGNTPLLEAIKSGHDQVASLLLRHGATLTIKDAGSFLCAAVAGGDTELLKRLVFNGADPNCKDYDQKSPLHIASSKGLYLMAKILIEAGAGVQVKDRWGNTPVDEAKHCGNKNLIKMLEDAKSTEICELQEQSDENTRAGKRNQKKKCTIYPSLPSEANGNQLGVVMWVPATIQELILAAIEKLNFPSGSCIVTVDGGEILETNMITDGEKLYLINKGD